MEFEALFKKLSLWGGATAHLGANRYCVSHTKCIQRIIEKGEDGVWESAFIATFPGMIMYTGEVAEVTKTTFGELWLGPLY